MYQSSLNKDTHSFWFCNGLWEKEGTLPFSTSILIPWLPTKLEIMTQYQIVNLCSDHRKLGLYKLKITLAKFVPYQEFYVTVIIRE